MGALTALVQEASEEFDMGPVYFFGYSNGGFMSYWMACQGLPGLRAVASLAGTSYMDDSNCEGAAPVSVLHIHSTDDAVVHVRRHRRGDRSVSGTRTNRGTLALRIWCDAGVRPRRLQLPDSRLPYGLGVDLDGRHTRGPRRSNLRLPGIRLRRGYNASRCGCSDEGSSHTPGYGDAFADALLDWLLAQE